MFVKLAADGRVSLEDRDNFRAFKLVVEGGPARLDQALRNQAFVRFHHGGAADARFLGAVANGGQPRARPERVRLDALCQAGGELGGKFGFAERGEGGDDVGEGGGLS